MANVFKKKVREAKSDLDRNNGIIKEHMDKAAKDDGPLWKWFVFYAVCLVLYCIVVGLIVTLVYLVACGILPQTVLLVASAIGGGSDMTAIDILLVIGVPCVFMAMLYAGGVIFCVGKLWGLTWGVRTKAKRKLGLGKDKDKT